MRSRADILRAVKQGATVRVLKHWQPNLQGATRTPKLVRNSGKKGIQTNGYYFDDVSHDGKPCEMWAEIPAASELAFNPDGSVTFHPNSERSWTLAFEVAA